MCGVSASSIFFSRLSAFSSSLGTSMEAATNPATAAAPIVAHGCTCIHARGSAPCASSRLRSSTARLIAAFASAACFVRNCASLSGVVGGLFDVAAELRPLLLLSGCILLNQPFPTRPGQLLQSDHRPAADQPEQQDSGDEIARPQVVSE